MAPVLPNGKGFDLLPRNERNWDVFRDKETGELFRFALEWETPQITIAARTKPFNRAAMHLVSNSKPFAPSPEKVENGKLRKQHATLGMDDAQRLEWFIAKPWRINSHNYRERKLAKRDARPARLLRLVDGALVEEVVEL